MSIRISYDLTNATNVMHDFDRRDVELGQQMQLMLLHGSLSWEQCASKEVNCP